MKHWYKLEIAYDGTDFSGWQWQPNRPTIQQTIKNVFLHAFKQTEIYLVGASRTDAGVHAHAQVARLGTLLDLKPQILINTLNKSLPHSIRINACTKLSDQEAFHPQHNVRSKTYVYRIFTKRPCPTQHRYGYFHWSEDLDREKLKQTLLLFIGTHDFKSFAKRSTNQPDTIRTITDIGTMIDEKTGEITVTICGASFLHHMIRRIVGASMAIASNPHRIPSEISEILAYPERMHRRLPTAPAQGLFLKQITYQEDIHE